MVGVHNKRKSSRCLSSKLLQTLGIQSMFGVDLLFYQAAAIKPRFLKSSKGSLKSHWYGSCIAYLGQLSNPLRILATLDNWLVKIGFRKNHIWIWKTDSLIRIEFRSDFNQESPDSHHFWFERPVFLSCPKMKGITFGEPWKKKWIRHCWRNVESVDLWQFDPSRWTWSL